MTHYYSRNAYSASTRYNSSSVTYDLSELDGILFGKVTFTTHSYGLIQPAKGLPWPYKKRTVFFHFSSVDGPALYRNDVVCFKLNCQSYQKPNTFWVKVSARGRTEHTGKGIKEVPSYTEEKTADVNGVNQQSPENLVVPRVTVCSHRPTDSEKNKNGVPSDSETKTKDPNDIDLQRPQHDDSSRGTVNSHGPTDSDKSTKTIPLDDEQKVEDPKELYIGKVVNICKGFFGFVEPKDMFPPPFLSRENAYFTMPLDKLEPVDNGHSALFTLDMTNHTRPTVAEIRFFGSEDDIPVKRLDCGHTCFEWKYQRHADMCLNPCSKTLFCGHACPKRCSEQCPIRCAACPVQRPPPKKTSYTLADLGEQKVEDPKELYIGTVVNICQGFFGFVERKDMFPPPFLSRENAYFTMPLDKLEPVDNGHSALFTLDMTNHTRPTVAEIRFFGSEDDIPVKRLDCGHTCFEWKHQRHADMCLNPCLKTLFCGHACPKRCSEQCPVRCATCPVQRPPPKKTSYTLADLGDVLHGTVWEINPEFGYLKLDYSLPIRFRQKNIYFTTPKTSDRIISKGDPAVCILNTKNIDPCAAEVAFANVSYDPNLDVPYKRQSCGHICFNRKNSAEKDVCLQKCTTTYPCGHKCLKPCSEKCLDNCRSCNSKPHLQTERVYTLEELGGILYGNVVNVYGHVGLIKPEHKLPPTLYVANSPVFFFPKVQGIDNISVGDLVVFELCNENYTAPTASQVTVIDADAQYMKMKPYVRPQCGHICFTMDGSTQLHCSKRCSEPRPCGHPCTEKCSEPCLPTCQKCILTNLKTEDNPVERLEVQAASNDGNAIVRYRLLPKRHLSFNDPKELNFRIAESQFLRLALKSGNQYEIESISYYVNPVLVRRFQAKRRDFQRKYGSQQEAKDVLAFHGTDKQSIDNIVRENFKLEYCERNKFGKGIYLSEFPHVSIHYGRSLLLCKVLPGRSHDVLHTQNDIPLRPGYDSHRVSADEDGYGWALVIDDPDQILPCYVINYRELN